MALPSSSSSSSTSSRWTEDAEYAYEYYGDGNENNANDNANDDYYENEEQRLQQAQGCKILFANILTPVCILVIITSIICCKWTVKDDTERKLEKKTIPPCIEFELTGEDSRDRKRYEEFKAYVTNQEQHLRSCYELLLLSLVCFTLWTYGMYSLSDDSDEPVEDFDEDERGNLFKFRHQSLGAFNFLGEVGQNANLYYSSWISLILCIAIVYELARITYKQHVSTKNLSSELEMISRHMVSYTKEIEMVMTWSKAQQQHMVKVRRSTWHESLHKLRFRAGFWLVVLIASIVIHSSSSRIWVNYVYPMAEANDEVDQCTIIDGFRARDDMGLLHPTMCQRTITSRATGVVCIALSLAALAAHYHFFRLIGKEMEASSILLGQKENTAQLFEKRKKLVPLRVEFGFALALTILLAYNAIFVTAVEGPGSKVGNLYYSSWISFVISMMIMLGCLEDILDQEEEQDLVMDGSDSFDRRNLTRWFSVRPINDHVSTRLIMLPSSHDSSGSGEDLAIGSYMGGMPIPTPNSFQQILEERFVQKEEDSRSTRLRRWASSCIFATLYLISVLDAAFHESYGELDFVQTCMIVCPCIFVSFCFIMTCLCVMDYQIVDNIFVGGVVAVLLMALWIFCLILTLHKESSWAINEIEQIENANIYYFTWATVLNTGMLSSSYVKPFMKKQFNMKPKGLMVVLWLAVVKICFVMFGSCIDILISVRNLCTAAEEGDSADIFCKRTEAGAVFGFLGMAAGFLAAVYRYFIPNPSINGLIGETIMSTVLATIFAFSLGMITGIGGPGQAVGDLYYGSWLAFFAALGVAGSLYAEILKQQKKEGMYVSSDSSTASSCEQSQANGSTPYSFWDIGKNESKFFI